MGVFKLPDPGLSAYIRYKLGEQLDYIGRGFLTLFSSDKEMVKTGQKVGKALH